MCLLAHSTSVVSKACNFSWTYSFTMFRSCWQVMNSINWHGVFISWVSCLVTFSWKRISNLFCLLVILLSVMLLFLFFIFWCWGRGSISNKAKLNSFGKYWRRDLVRVIFSHSSEQYFVNILLVILSIGLLNVT